MKKKLFAGFGLLVATLSYSQLINAGIPAGYHATNLGSLNNKFSHASAISDLGWVVGWSNSDAKYYQATLWKNGEIISLPDLGGSKSKAIAVNNVGQVIGATMLEDPTLANQNFGTKFTRIFLWENNVSIDISSPEILFANHPTISPSDVYLVDMSPQLTSNNSVNDYAISINDAGQVIMMGSIAYNCGQFYYCWAEMNFVYQNGQAKVLIVGDNPYSSRIGKYGPVTINQSGNIGASAELVVGDNGGGNLVSEYHGIIVNTDGVKLSTVTTRPECLNHRFHVRGFNDNGTLIGQSCIETSPGVLNLKRGFIWSVTTGLQELPIMGTNAQSYVIPRSINNSGLIVANSVEYPSNQGDVLYDQFSGPVLLHDIIDNAIDIVPGHLAWSINNDGVIVGDAHFKAVSYVQAVKYTPIP